MISSVFFQLEPLVTWIKVEKPSFDLVGVVLSSFRIAGILLVLALVLGLLLGGALLRARRRAGVTSLDSVSLHLDTRG
jgi:ABC-type spermidine/putrescine transport system permease subunit II